MRIKSFSEARGIFESEEFSLEPHIYCFGGGGGGGGGGGDSMDDDPDGDFDAMGGSAGDAMGGSAGDFEGTNFGGDTATAGGSLGGGSDSNDNDGDGIPNSIDATPGVPGTPSGPTDAFDAVGSAYDAAVDSIAAGIDAFGPGGAAGRDAPPGGSAGDFEGVSFDGPSISDIDLGFDEGEVGTDNVAFAAPGFAPPSFATTSISVPDSIAEVQARNALSGATDITSGLQTGTRDVDTTIDPSDPFDPFGEGGLTAAERAALDAQIAADNARISALTQALSTPAPSVGPGQTVSSAEMQSRIASAGSAGTRPSTVQGQSVLSVGLGPNKQEFTFDNTVPPEQRSYTQISGPSLGGATGALDIDIFDEQPADITITGGQPAFSFSRDVLGVDQSIPQMSLAPESRPSQFDRQARMGEVQGPMSMAPVDATRFSGVDMMRQADDVLSERAIDEAIFGDTSGIPSPTLRAGAEIVNALESMFGGNQARKIADVANRPGGALVRDPRSGEVLGAVGPEENIRSAFMGAQDAVYVGDPRGYEQGVEIGTSILGPDTTVRDVGTVDPFTGEMEGRPGADYSVTDTTVDRGGDTQTAPPPSADPDPTTGDCPDGYSYNEATQTCEYVGRDVVGATPYTPMGPVSISYTGLPSLAPRTLQPTAPNLNFLTRSQTAQPGTTRTQAMGPDGSVVNIPNYADIGNAIGDIRDARTFMPRSRGVVRQPRPQGIAGLTKS